MINITKNEDGLRVASDYMADVETVTVALCVGIGSRFEDSRTNGMSHFLEHMAFKGTKTKNAKEIAEIIDNAGGYINAYTSKERTVYYVKLLAKDVEIAVELLADILQNSTFEKEEIERERGVILQEIAASNDTPDDIVFDYYYNTIYPEQALGRNILGSKENVSSFQREDFVEYISTKYHAGNMVLAIAGKVTHEEIEKLTKKYFSNLNKVKEVELEKASYKKGDFEQYKENLEQTQFILSFPGISYHNEAAFYTMQMASSILGGSMSSRLFQEIREKRGLVYTVSSFSDSHTDTGTFGVYAGTSYDKLDELKSATLAELEKASKKIDSTELKRAKTQSEVGLLMSKESTSSRAQRLGKSILNFGRYITDEEIMGKVSAITEKDIQGAIKNAISEGPTTIIYGGKE